MTQPLDTPRRVTPVSTTDIPRPRPDPDNGSGTPSPATGPRGHLAATAPGLVAVAAATAAAFAVAGLVPGLGAAGVAVLLGLVAANTGLHHRVLHPGTAFAAKHVLRAAIVLLGLQLAVPQLIELGGTGALVVVVTVLTTFIGAQLLGRLLRVPTGQALFVATGFSICGASAIAAMKATTDGDDEDAGVAIAMVTIFGSLAILVLPLLQGPLALDAGTWGLWVGASVQDVGQTVATASQVDGALASAVVVKLSRVVLLAPLVAAVAFTMTRRRGRDLSGRRPPLVPLFVVGFLAAIALTSTGVLPAAALDVTATVQKALLVAALVGLGTGIRFSALRRSGARVLVLGLASWVLVAGVALAGILLLDL